MPANLYPVPVFPSPAEMAAIAAEVQAFQATLPSPAEMAAVAAEVKAAEIEYRHITRFLPPY